MSSIGDEDSLLLDVVDTIISHHYYHYSVLFVSIQNLNREIREKIELKLMAIHLPLAACNLQKRRILDNNYVSIDNKTGSLLQKDLFIPFR